MDTYKCTSCDFTGQFTKSKALAQRLQLPEVCPSCGGELVIDVGTMKESNRYTHIPDGFNGTKGKWRGFSTFDPITMASIFAGGHTGYGEEKKKND